MFSRMQRPKEKTSQVYTGHSRHAIPRSCYLGFVLRRQRLRGTRLCYRKPSQDEEPWAAKEIEKYDVKPLASMKSQVMDRMLRTHAVSMDAATDADPLDAENFCMSYPELLDRREWPAGDLENNFDYLKTYQLRGIGEYIEIWVADDVAYPDPDDCRNVLNTTQVTHEQIANFIHEFDSNIFPAITSEWFVPPPRNGTQTNLELSFAENATECTFQGNGSRIVTLVDNIRDEDYYTPLGAPRLSYFAGFYFDLYDYVTDRNIMTIDVFDWLHRSGANPPDDTVNPLYQPCAALIGRNTTFESQPRIYESVFAHEFGHLLESFVEGTSERETWLGEMMAEYAAYLVGYMNLSVDPADHGFDDTLELVLGFAPAEAQPDGGPEQSLSSWCDQGEVEILADCSAVRGFALYITGRFGRSFLGEFSTVPNATGLQGLQDFLKAKEEDTTIQEIIQDWVVAMAVSGELSRGAALQSNTRVQANLLMPLVPLSRINWDTYQAYNSSGAPNNGADYVRFRDEDDMYVSANKVKRIEFIGSLDYEAPPGLGWTQECTVLWERG